MTTTQLFFALAGLQITMNGALAAAFKLYLDAKIDPIDKRLGAMEAGQKMFITYMIDHESRISRLEERTK